MVRGLITLFLGLLLFASSTAAALTTRLDRQQIAIDETVNLIISSDEASPATPDITPLKKDFTLLSNEESQQFTMINGNSRLQTQWLITLNPKRQGVLTIPALTVGKQTTKPLTLKVTKAITGPNGKKIKDLAIESVITPEKPYLSSQALLTIKVFYKHNLRSGTLTEPTGNNILFTRMGDDINYSTRRNGNIYQVVERRYAIFPEKSGQLLIDPIVFTGEIESLGRKQSVGSFFASNSKPVRVISPERHFTVKPKPSNFVGTWLPAQSLSLTEDWSSKTDDFKIGEPITRTIHIKANGLSAEQLPELAIQTPQGMKLYTNKPVLKNTIQGNAVVGERIEKIAYIPTQQGKLNIPAIQLSWWNTTKNQVATSHLKATTFQVAADPKGASQTTAVDHHKQAAIHPSHPTSTKLVKPFIASWWPSFTALFALLWLVTTFLWWQQRSKTLAHSPRSDSQQEKQIASLRTIKQSLKQACHQNDPKACEASLLEYARIWFSQPIRSLGALALICEEKTARSAINQLEYTRYSSGKQHWDGDQCWQDLQNWLKQKSSKTRTSEVLPPLNPNLN